MTSKLGGRPVKGSEIVNNFSVKGKTTLSRKELKKVKASTKLCSVCRKHPAHSKGLCNTCYSKERTKGLKIADANYEDLDNDKSSNQMLQDMRWVYRKIKGRDKLKKLIKDDDRQFVFMVKELMKIESALLTTKIRKEGGDSITTQKAVFVVLKGLEDEKQITEVLSSSDVDIKKIQRAINPAMGDIYDNDEESKNKWDAPEQLHKQIGTVEND